MAKRKSALLGLLALGTLATACLDTTEPVEIIFWQGSLQPVPEAPVALGGGMTMMADQSFTMIGVGVEGGEAGSQLGWAIRHGSCDETGELVGPPGTFTELLLDDAGDGETQAILYRRIPDADVYAGEVLSSLEAGGEVLACADLIRIP